MRRLVSLLAGLVIASVLVGSTASARGIEWCAEDPIFEVLGADFRITTFINSPASDVTSIEYVVQVPENAGDATYSFPKDDPLRHITTVTFDHSGKAFDAARDDSFTVRVTLTVSGPDHARVIAELDGLSVDEKSFKGTTKRALQFRFSVTP